MYRSLFSIAEELGIAVNRWYEPATPDNDYRYCLWLGNTEKGFRKNCVYVGYASQLPEELPVADTGFIVVNDTGRDFGISGADVIELDRSSDPAEVCLLIRDRIFEDTEVSLASYKLISRLVSMSKIKELVDIIADILDNPVFLNFHYLGQTFYFSGTSAEDDQIEALRELKNRVHDDAEFTSINRIWNASKPELTEDGFIYPGHRRIQAAIREGISSQSRIGIITVFEVRQRFTEEDIALIGLIAHIISQKAGDRDFKTQITGFQYEQFFQDMLRGIIPKVRPNWINSVFSSAYSNYHLAVLDVHTLSEITRDSIRFKLKRMCNNSISFMRGTYLVTIANIEPDKEAGYLEELESIALKYQISIGFSDDYTDVLNSNKYYTQARKAREAGCGKTMKPGVFSFSDYRSILLAQSLKSDGTSELYVNDAYKRLKEKDEKEETEYCSTLETYIACGFDNAETAKTLNIHRNTLGYRLKRIEEITGHSLKDGKFLKSLILSASIINADE